MLYILFFPGYGIYHYMFLASDTKQTTDQTGWLVRGLHCVLSLTICVMLENLKLPKDTHIVLFYSFTFSKFCVLALAVGMVTKLFVGQTNKNGTKMKRS